MGRDRGRVGKELRPLERIARAAGWTIRVTAGGHFAWRSPEGKTVYTSATSSVRNVVRYVASDLQAAGLVLPDGWDGHTRSKSLRAADEPNMIEVTPRDLATATASSTRAEQITTLAPVVDMVGKPVDPAHVGRMLIRDLTDDDYDTETRRRAWAIVSGTARTFESEEPGQHTNDIVEYERGTAVATIAASATWSGLNLKIVCEVAQSVYDALCAWTMQHPEAVEGRQQGRIHIRRPIKGVICGKLNDAGVTDEAELNLYTQAMYRLLQDTNSGAPALIKMQAHTGSTHALWSLAETWTAPASIVPMFLSRTKGTAMTSAERRLSDHEANEDGSRSDPVIVVNNTGITTSSEHYAPDEQFPDLPWKCRECGERFPAPSALGGHISNRHSRLSQPSDEAIEAAVRKTLGRIFGTTDEAEVAAVREENIALYAQLGEAMGERDRMCGERDEAVAALRLILTEYINPRVLEGVVDVRHYLSDSPDS